jgi:hypothetical protein
MGFGEAHPLFDKSNKTTIEKKEYLIAVILLGFFEV